MNQKNDQWDGYFSRHYQTKFDRTDILRAQNFMHGQLKILNKIAPFDKDDSVLEIGCALGAFIETLKQSGVKNISAIELDEYAAEHVRKTQDVEVSTSKIMDYSSDQLFDKIYAFEVLEHPDDPIRDIEKIYHLLKPGGHFICSSPYPFKRSISSDESHLFVLHPDNWQRLFVNAGFSVRLSRPATGLPFAYRLNQILSVYFKFYMPILPLVSTTLFVLQKKE
jgi:2-polyprenyl-3-methyl-5-hydroxy-6-metoxy-1,4-benzoquinol methylase